MTITQAGAVNLLARYLLPALDENNVMRPANDRVTTDEARSALKTLVLGAYKALLAGASPADIDQAWPAGAELVLELPRPLRASCTLCDKPVNAADAVVGQASGPHGRILEDGEVAHAACLASAQTDGDRP